MKSRVKEQTKSTCLAQAMKAFHRVVGSACGDTPEGNGPLFLQISDVLDHQAAHNLPCQISVSEPFAERHLLTSCLDGQAGRLLLTVAVIEHEGSRRILLGFVPKERGIVAHLPRTSVP